MATRDFLVRGAVPGNLGVGVAKNGRFAIDDGVANLEVGRRFGDGGKLPGPVVATAGIDRYVPVPDVDLRPVAISLDLINPAVTGWGALLHVGSQGSTKPGIGALEAPVALRGLRVENRLNALTLMATQAARAAAVPRG